MMKCMRVLITGAGGTLGRALIKRFEREPSVYAIGVDRDISALKVNCPLQEVIQVDISTPAFPRVLHYTQPHVIIHTAWDMSSTDNDSTAQQVFTAASECDTITHVIFISSIAVYGARNGTELCDESTSLMDGFVDDYGRQKRNAERELHTLHAKMQGGLAMTIIRPCNIQDTLPFIVYLNRWIPFPSSQPLYRQFVNSLDVADVIAQCALHEETDSSPINILNVAPEPQYIRTIYFPERWIQCMFACVWYLTRYSRMAPGKWITYVHTPRVNGARAKKFLNGKYRTLN